LSPVNQNFLSINLKRKNLSTALLSCVGERSWLFFNLLQSFDESAVDWMFAPVECWDKMIGYQKLKRFVSAVEVVNDCAEP
jgi:hypothetical protein